MKIIMENWRKANEHQELLQEQLLLEGFLDSLSQVAGDIKNMFTAFSKLLKQPDKIRMFTGFVAEKIINPAMKKIKETLEKVQQKFQDKESSDTTLVSSMIVKINDSVSKIYNFVKGLTKGTWKKAVSSVGLAVVLEFFSSKILVQMPVEAGIEEIMDFFNDEIMDFLTNFLGEALVDALSGAMTSGISTFVSVLAKIVNGTSFVAEVLSSAIEPFLKKGVVSLAKFEEQIN
tara:strand:+ start:1244 stop:1939 length:696 start_codon:yes stop_codon:yes gene_type:complete